MTKKKSDQNKTKEELIREITGIRQRISQLEKIERERKQTEKDLQQQQKILQDLFKFEEEVSQLDIHEVVRRALIFIEKKIDVSRVSIALLEDDNSGFRFFDVRLKIRMGQANFVPYGSLFAEIVQKKMPMYKPDLAQWDTTEMIGIKLKKAGLKSFFVVPLIVEARCIGTLNCASLEKDGIPGKKRQMLQHFAPRLAQALHQLKLFEALAEQKEFLKATIESISDGILVVSENGEVAHANQRFYEMWHMPEKMVGVRDHNELLKYSAGQLTDPEVFLSKIRQLYQSPQEDFETFTFKDGRVFERLSFPLMREGEIAGRVWGFRDITEKKRAEQEKLKLLKLLQHSQKMEAIGTLAGGIAHDFNNILGLIIGFTELATDDVPENSITGKNLQKVLTASNRAKKLVKQILAFSRKDKEEQKSISLNHMIRESLNLLRASLPTTIEIRTNIANNLYPILANPTQIHQVIMNLCTNAAYAMKDRGGILEITLKEIDLESDSLENKDLQPGRYQRLCICDTGHGIDPGIKNRIFEPYFTTKPTGEGSGMGLAVVYGIVKSHGGEITVYSEPGKGSAFHLFFKVAREETILETEIQANQQVPGGSECILFVDDEQYLVEMGERVLGNLGYHIVGTTSSIEALEMFRREPSKYDLVITDQTMPKMTGIQLTEELRNIKPNIPVILCTGFSESVNEESFKPGEMDLFLMKPVTRQELASKIRCILDGENIQKTEAGSGGSWV